MFQPCKPTLCEEIIIRNHMNKKDIAFKIQCSFIVIPIKTSLKIILFFSFRLTGPHIYTHEALSDSKASVRIFLYLVNINFASINSDRLLASFARLFHFHLPSKVLLIHSLTIKITNDAVACRRPFKISQFAAWDVLFFRY